MAGIRNPTEVHLPEELPDLLDSPDHDYGFDASSMVDISSDLSSATIADQDANTAARTADLSSGPASSADQEANMAAPTAQLPEPASSKDPVSKTCTDKESHRNIDAPSLPFCSPVLTDRLERRMVDIASQEEPLGVAEKTARRKRETKEKRIRSSKSELATQQHDHSSFCIGVDCLQMEQDAIHMPEAFAARGHVLSGRETTCASQEKLLGMAEKAARRKRETKEKRKRNSKSEEATKQQGHSSLCIGVGCREMEQDAIDMSEALAARGYDHRVLLSGSGATQAAIHIALEDMLCTCIGTVFVFVSAHAGWCNGDCFMAPHGVSQNHSASLAREGVSVNFIRRRCLASDNNVILVLDTCFSGNVVHSDKRRSAKRDRGPGRVILASSLPRRVSTYIQGGNSVFTGLLLAVIRGGGMAALQLLADEVGLEPDWMHTIEESLLEQWMQAETAGLHALVLAEMLVELVDAGLGRSRDHQRPLLEVCGQPFPAFGAYAI